MKKRLFSVLLSFALALSLLPTAALATGSAQQEYDLANGNITVSVDADGKQYVTQVGGKQNELQTGGTVITGTTTANTLTIEAATGQTAEVTLSGVNIDVSTASAAAVATTGEGDVAIKLSGSNTLKSGENHAGLEKGNTGTLTISGTNAAADSLTATGGNYGAGIGGGKDANGKNITIEDAAVTATGGNDGAGIGGGQSGLGENITIKNSTVTATGGRDGVDCGGAGIGGGSYKDGKNITIEGSTVTATSDGAGAGIGGGTSRDGCNITLKNSTVTAKGGFGSAGIGSGYKGTGSENIVISGSTQLKVQGGRKRESGGMGDSTAIGGGSRDASEIDDAADRYERDPGDGVEIMPGISSLGKKGYILYYDQDVDMNTAKPNAVLHSGCEKKHEVTSATITGGNDIDLTCSCGFTISSRKESSYYSPRYAITVGEAKNGSVSVSAKSAYSGTTVTITTTPDTGYTLETLNVTDRSGNTMDLDIVTIGEKYTFRMPYGDVTVEATFMEDNTILNYFVDIPITSYYYEAVLWAAENGIAKGDGLFFNPGEPCTRAQVVTFLWRAAGSPEPKNMSSFDDVPAGSYCAKAVAWAAENGITKGTSDTTFSPNDPCTRAQAVTFLYRAVGAETEGDNTFPDVADDAYYHDAVTWAEKNEIEVGVCGLFCPDNDCTRAKFVTYLWKAMAE